MGNRKELVSSLQELREDNIRKQKRGLHLLLLLFHLGSSLRYPYILIADFVKKLIHLLLFNTISSVGFFTLENFEN
mgnify:CR=1 FL=1